MCAALATMATRQKGYICKPLCHGRRFNQIMTTWTRNILLPNGRAQSARALSAPQQCPVRHTRTANAFAGAVHSATCTHIVNLIWPHLNWPSTFHAPPCATCASCIYADRCVALWQIGSSLTEYLFEWTLVRVPNGHH